jgi:transglutaminase-like putative cysteine protease
MPTLASASATDDAGYLEPGRFIDSGHPAIGGLAERVTAGIADQRSKAIALYHAIRDGVDYDLYLDYTDPSNFRASGVLAHTRGFCVGKAALLAASCRAAGIPARVGYADVRNHMTSRRLYEMMQTDIFTWHSYADIELDGRWVKATPAFDKALCERIGLAPLEFDGEEGSLFQPIDPEGRRRMEYLNFRGVFADVPVEEIVADFRVRYPGLFGGDASRGRFREEASGQL